LECFFPKGSQVFEDAEKASMGMGRNMEKGAGRRTITNPTKRPSVNSEII
jgi:hypothetical protein